MTARRHYRLYRAALPWIMTISFSSPILSVMFVFYMFWYNLSKQVKKPPLTNRLLNIAMFGFCYHGFNAEEINNFPTKFIPKLNMTTLLTILNSYWELNMLSMLASPAESIVTATFNFCQRTRWVCFKLSRWRIYVYSL